MYAGCAGKTVRSLRTRVIGHLSALERYVHDKALYKSTLTFTFTYIV